METYKPEEHLKFRMPSRFRDISTFCGSRSAPMMSKVDCALMAEALHKVLASPRWVFPLICIGRRNISNYLMAAPHAVLLCKWPLGLPNIYDSGRVRLQYISHFQLQSETFQSLLQAHSHMECGKVSHTHTHTHFAEHVMTSRFSFFFAFVQWYVRGKQKERGPNKRR